MISANVRVKHPFFCRVCECATFVESTCGDCMISLARPRLCCHRAFFDVNSLAFLHEFWACDVIVIFFHGAGFCAMLIAICVPPSIVRACMLVCDARLLRPAWVRFPWVELPSHTRLRQSSAFFSRMGQAIARGLTSGSLEDGRWAGCSEWEFLAGVEALARSTALLCNTTTAVGLH